ENERLIFPLNYVPLAMTDPASGRAPTALHPFFRDRLMWMGFAIPTLLHACNSLHQYWPTVPELKIRDVRLDANLTAKPWNAARPLGLWFYPMAVGLAYLLSRDISFGLWFFYFIGKAEAVLGTALGLGGGGSASLAGFPFFSGFFSKDEILDAAYSVHPILGGIGLLAALLTAFYTFRMIFWAFHGPQRVPQNAHPHESGYWMLVPMGILAVGAVIGGYVDVSVSSSGFAGIFEPGGALHRFLEPVFRETYGIFTATDTDVAEGGGHVLMYVSSALAVLGILGAYLLYVRRRDWAEAVVNEIPDVYDLIHGKYYVDELYDTLVVRPARQAGLLLNAIDDYVIDGLIWVITVVPRAGGFVLRGLQGGALQGYAMTMTAGVVLILLFVLMGG
ncbi:MAG TPA: hypothetical protein PLC79_09375, partial [Phycisphaerae bacterium]|nr:hypothetical protein [Phycisphaerae bacterium]